MNDRAHPIFKPLLDAIAPRSSDSYGILPETYPEACAKAAKLAAQGQTHVAVEMWKDWFAHNERREEPMTETVPCSECGREVPVEDALDCPDCGQCGAGPNPAPAFCSRSCLDSHHADYHEPKSLYQLRAERYAEEGGGDE